MNFSVIINENMNFIYAILNINILTLFHSNFSQIGQYLPNKTDRQSEPSRKVRNFLKFPFFQMAQLSRKKLICCGLHRLEKAIPPFITIPCLFALKTAVLCGFDTFSYISIQFFSILPSLILERQRSIRNACTHVARDGSNRLEYCPIWRTW